MPRFRRRRRYDPNGYPPPGYPPPGYQRRGGSCARDACLMETGCCIGEALDNNCLVAGFLLLPHLLGAALRPGGRGGAAARITAAIRVYQRDISAHRPAVCRFTPSCSRYATEAIATHGALRGTLLAARRLLRCRPGGARGTDPVPA